MPTERDVDIVVGAFTISDDGEIAGTFKESHSGYSAWNARQQFATDGKTKYLDKAQKRRPNWQIEKADFTGLDPQANLFDEHFTLTIPEACGRAGDRLFLRKGMVKIRLKKQTACIRLTLLMPESRRLRVRIRCPPAFRPRRYLSPCQ